MFFAPAIRSDSLMSPALRPDLGFERFMQEALGGFGTGWGMEEDDKSWTLTLDVPGVSRDHLSVSITGQTVRIETTGEAKRQYKAIYELPGAINTDACDAKLEDGVLTLRLAKAEARSRRQITVN